MMSKADGRLSRDTTQTLTRRLRKVTTQLGTVRELDVLMLLIEERRRKKTYSPAALARLSATIADRRDAAYERLTLNLPTAKLIRLTDKFERVAERVRSDDARSRRSGERDAQKVWRWTLDARLFRRAAQARSAIEATHVVYKAERFHGVRIALKKLRYAAELSTEARTEGAAADITALKGAQDLLGQLHDLEVLLNCARETQALLSPPNVAAWRELGSLVQDVENDCRHLHACYVCDRVRLIAIANRFGADNLRAPSADRLAAG